MGIVNLLGGHVVPSDRNSTTFWQMVLRVTVFATAAATGTTVGPAQFRIYPHWDSIRTLLPAAFSMAMLGATNLCSAPWYWMV